MKRKILTRIEILKESIDNGMPEIQVINLLDLGKQKLRTSDILFIEEFCVKTGLDKFLEPKKQYRHIYKTQRDLRLMNRPENVGKNNC